MARPADWSARYYWKDDWKAGNPKWIIGKDPQGRAGSFLVKFWKDDWKDLLKEYIDRIVEDNYDGICFDYLKAYASVPVAEAAAKEGKDSRLEIFKFVRDLRSHALSKKSNLLILSQNAAELGEFTSHIENFDAVLQEEIWFDGTDIAVKQKLTDSYLYELKQWQMFENPVFNIEYASDTKNVKQAY